MVKKAIVIAVMSLLFIVGAGVYDDSIVDGEEAAPIPTIQIVTPAWDNQTHEDGTGLFFDIVRAVYEPVGIHMEFEIVPWKRAKMMLDNNQADARLAIVRTSNDQRMPQYPLYSDETVAVFKKETFQSWNGVETLQGKSVVWMRGYDYHIIPPFSTISMEWSEVNNYEQAWKMLETGRTDVYIDARIDVEPYIKEHHIDMTLYRVEILYRRNAYLEFALSQKSDTLIEIYDTRIQELLKSGELEHLFKKWDVPFTSFSPAEEE